MMTEKDRSQILRMAGNIACGLVTNCNVTTNDEVDDIVEIATKMACKIVLRVDATLERLYVIKNK